MTITRNAVTAGLTVTLGLAAACWIVAVRQMSGMDMGVATDLGPFAPFAALWVAMMAAMMLPSAAPAVVRSARTVSAVTVFVAGYLTVWMLVGIAVYALYVPHGTFAAGIVTIAAGVYELTPLKRHFRRRCREVARSGFAFGLCCVGSCIGLMLMMAALSIMNVTLMTGIAGVVLIQKLFPPHAAVDAPFAFAIVGLGFLIVAAPSWVPGLLPAM